MQEWDTAGGYVRNMGILFSDLAQSSLKFWIWVPFWRPNKVLVGNGCLSWYEVWRDPVMLYVFYKEVNLLLQGLQNCLSSSDSSLSL